MAGGPPAPFGREASVISSKLGEGTRPIDDGPARMADTTGSKPRSGTTSGTAKVSQAAPHRLGQHGLQSPSGRQPLDLAHRQILPQDELYHVALGQQILPEFVEPGVNAGTRSGALLGLSALQCTDLGVNVIRLGERSLASTAAPKFLGVSDV